MKKSGCKKGYSCGASCISQSYDCNIDFPPKAQGPINKMMGWIKGKISDLKNKVRGKSDKDYMKENPREFSFDKNKYQVRQGLGEKGGYKYTEVDYVTEDGHIATVRVESEPHKSKDGRMTHIIDFKIDDEWDTNDENIPKRDRLEAAREINNIFKGFISQTPKGDVYEGEVWSGDGKDAMRERAYKKKGFKILPPDKPRGLSKFSGIVGQDI